MHTHDARTHTHTGCPILINALEFIHEVVSKGIYFDVYIIYYIYMN